MRSQSKQWSRRVERYWHTKKRSPATVFLQTLLSQNLEIYKPRKILEVGCGPGIFTERLGEVTWTVAIDISECMLKFVKDRGVSVELVRADMNHLPFKAMSFDLVVAYRVLEYSRKHKETLKSFSELAPVVFLQLPRHDSINGVLLFFLRWILIFLGRGSRFKSYSLKEAMRLAGEAGLTIVDITTYNRGLDIHIVLSRQLKSSVSFSFTCSTSINQAN